jgi:putative transposase
VLAQEFDFANQLNSMARQAAAERAWAAVTRFYDNCKKQIPGQKGFPQFQKDCRSVEYKTSGWKLAEDRKSITMTDKCGIGRLKLKGSRDLHFYQVDQIKRVKGSNNRRKARQVLGKRHLKISRQRKDHAVKLARCVITSNDVVAYEDLRIQNMVRNHCLAKSINDASWYQFRQWLEYFGKVFGKTTLAVPAAGTSQECPECHGVVKKSLSTRTHACRCGCVLPRDYASAQVILRRGLGTVGHTGTFMQDMSNAWGEDTATPAGANLHGQVTS